MSSSTVSSSWSKRGLYLAMVGLALLAGSLDHAMHRNLEELGATVQKALRLSLLRLLDGMEVAALTQRAKQEEDKAAGYQQSSAMYRGQASRDEHYAVIQRHRGDYLERLSHMETSQAAMHAQLAQQDDAERVALLHNITALEADKNETLAELETFHTGACDWKFVSAVCRTVGGATELQKRADADSLAIQNEWQRANELERQEAMQNLVAEMMTTKAHRYDKAAHDLWDLAGRWDAAAQNAWQEAQKDNITAKKLWQQADHDIKVTERDQAIESKVDYLVAGLMQKAEMQRSAAFWCAVGALLSAATAVVFFGGKVIPKAHASIQTLEATRDTSHMAYMGLHVLIFMAVLGIAGHFFVNLDHYTTIQRAVILIWFASVASLGQALALHAVPWALQQTITTTQEPADALAFCLEMSMRVVLLGALFLMEILLVWLTFGHAIFSPLFVGICGNWFFRLVVVGAIVAYGIWVEGPRREAESVDDATTLTSASWPENQSISFTQASEATPLRKADVLSWGTTIDLAMSGPADGTVAVSSASAFGALVEDMSRLILPLEVLFVACMVAVSINALHVVWISHATWIQCSVLVCAMGLLLVAFWFTHEACCEQTWATTSNRSRRKDDSATTTSLRMRPKFEMVQV